MSPSSSLINSARGEEAVHTATHRHTHRYTASPSWYHSSSASSLFCLAKIRQTGRDTHARVGGKKAGAVTFSSASRYRRSHIHRSHTRTSPERKPGSARTCTDISSERGVPYSRLSRRTRTLHCRFFPDAVRFSPDLNRPALRLRSYKPGHRIYEGISRDIERK